MRKFRAIIDMDGTVVDFTTDSNKRVKELYGIELTDEDLCRPKTAQIVWEKLTDEQKSKFNDHRELYADICNKGFFRNLKPYPGAVEAVKRLADADVEIVFVTKVLNWDRSAPEKDEWLREYFPDMDYLKIMVDQREAKAAVNADVIVDDDHIVLDEMENTVCIMVKQSWNVSNRNYAYTVDSMAEAADIVLRLKDVYDRIQIAKAQAITEM